MNPARHVLVSGGFDDIGSRRLRFLQEAATLGALTVLLWPDDLLQRHTGRVPTFPLAERLYFLNAVRYVTRAVPLAGHEDVHSLPAQPDFRPDVWLDDETDASDARHAFCQRHGIEYRVLPGSQMSGFPVPPPQPAAPGCKTVVVSGSFDWLHTGHVRFFEQVSACGNLYVVVGHDANIRLLKGDGHPLLSEDERRYVVGSIKYVSQALISSGRGWLDADPEIRRLKPDIYAVNEDGDTGGKREYCERLGIDYLVLTRTPAPGLPRRCSTDLRGF